MAEVAEFPSVTAEENENRRRESIWARAREASKQTTAQRFDVPKQKLPAIGEMVLFFGASADPDEKRSGQRAFPALVLGPGRRPGTLELCVFRKGYTRYEAMVGYSAKPRIGCWGYREPEPKEEK